MQRKMKTTKYPEAFENLWKYFLIAADEGLIGSLGKKAAYQAYCTKECTPEDSEYLIKCLSNQIANKKNERRFNGFTPNFQSPSRWISKERYEDPIIEPVNGGAVRPLTRREETRAAIAKLAGQAEGDSQGTGIIDELGLIE